MNQKLPYFKKNVKEEVMKKYAATSVTRKTREQKKILHKYD